MHPGGKRSLPADGDSELLVGANTELDHHVDAQREVAGAGEKERK